MTGDYYVYVYIDPRNLEEFYFGQGKGKRKNAHLFQENDSEKIKRIKAIKKAGLEPIVRVIASNLTKHDALLVEKTLLWKLGKQLTNVSSGHYSKNFRPHNTLHLLLSGFDFQRNIYFYNVGEGSHRNWDDYRKYSFISAGQAPRFRDAMLGFYPGDIFAAYIAGKGFVGIGKILESAKPIRKFFVKRKPLISFDLKAKMMADNIDSDKNCEYVCSVKWICAVDRKDAKRKPEAGVRTVRASLDRRPKVIKFLNEAFNINLDALRAD